MNPKQILTREALSQEVTTSVSPQDRENHDLQILSKTLMDLIRQEAIRN